MKKPKIATVNIQWIDEHGNEHQRNYTENTLEIALTLLLLMTGHLGEDDFKH